MSDHTDISAPDNAETDPSPIPPVSPLAAALDAPLEDEPAAPRDDKRPMSADGFPIAVGMKVAHFDDEWENRGDVLMIDRKEQSLQPGHHAVWFEVYFRNKWGSISQYQSEILFASRGGLLRNKLDRARAQVLHCRRELLDAESKVEQLEAKLPCWPTITPASRTWATCCASTRSSSGAASGPKQ